MQTYKINFLIFLDENMVIKRISDIILSEDSHSSATAIGGYETIYGSISQSNAGITYKSYEEVLNNQLAKESLSLQSNFQTTIGDYDTVLETSQRGYLNFIKNMSPQFISTGNLPTAIDVTPGVNNKVASMIYTFVPGTNTIKADIYSFSQPGEKYILLGEGIKPGMWDETDPYGVTDLNRVDLVSPIPLEISNFTYHNLINIGLDAVLTAGDTWNYFKPVIYETVLEKSFPYSSDNSRDNAMINFISGGSISDLESSNISISAAGNLIFNKMLNKIPFGLNTNGISITAPGASDICTLINKSISVDSPISTSDSGSATEDVPFFQVPIFQYKESFKDSDFYTVGEISNIYSFEQIISQYRSVDNTKGDHPMFSTSWVQTP